MSIKDMAAAIIEQVEKGDPIDPDAAAAVAAWAQEAAGELKWELANSSWGTDVSSSLLIQWNEGAK